jgi:hypothetical protein
MHVLHGGFTDVGTDTDTDSNIDFSKDGEDCGMQLGHCGMQL